VFAVQFGGVVVSAELGEEHLRLLAHHKFKEPERRQMVEDLALEPGDRVLDLGCGIGLWSGWIAEKVVPGGRVVGLDVNPASTSIAKGRTRFDLNSDVIDYEVGDAWAIPFKRGTFDALFCANTFEYFSEPWHYLQEMKRVVRRAGKVAVKDIDAGQMALYPVQPELMAGIVVAMTRLVQHRCAHADEYAGRVLDFFVGRKLHSWFQRAGFESITTRSYAMTRTQPLGRMAIRHLQGLAQFWQSELVPFLSARHLAELKALFDDRSEEYLLSRPDFCYLDVETLTIGIV